MDTTFNSDTRLLRNPRIGAELVGFRVQNSLRRMVFFYRIPLRERCERCAKNLLVLVMFDEIEKW